MFSEIIFSLVFSVERLAERLQQHVVMPFQLECSTHMDPQLFASGLQVRRHFLPIIRDICSL